MTDSPLDLKVKKNLLKDTLHILNLGWKRKNRYINQIKTDMASRLVGKNRMTAEEKEQTRAKKLRIKDKYEQSNMGDFQNLYPLRRGLIPRHDDLMEEYESIHKRAKEVYDETSHGGYLPF